MSDQFESIADAWEWAQSPVGNGPASDPSNPEQALALLMSYAFGGFTYTPYEDADELINELGEVVWNTLRDQQAKIAEQKEYLREGTRAEIEMMQRSLKERIAIREVIAELLRYEAGGADSVAIQPLLDDLKAAINYRNPREGSRRV